jgi:hypothetical protein
MNQKSKSKVSKVKNTTEKHVHTQLENPIGGVRANPTQEISEEKAHFY